MTDIQQRRNNFDQLGKTYASATSIQVSPIAMGGVNCYWFIPGNTTTDKIIIHLHGGAYAVGSIRSHQSMITHFAAAFRAKILFIDYALAPEHPFPAAMLEVMDVYTRLIADHPGQKIAMTGDSAGAGLIVSGIAEMIRLRLPLPAAALMLSPWIDLSCNNPSYASNRTKDLILSKEYIQASAMDYTGSKPLETVNPADIRFGEFPPVLILAGTNEVLLDDSINFFNGIAAIQPRAILSIYAGQQHVWPLADIHSAASKQALQEMAAFLDGSWH